MHSHSVIWYIALFIWSMYSRNLCYIVPLTEDGDVAYIVESEESDIEEEEEEEELDPDAIVSIDDQGDYPHI